MQKNMRALCVNVGRLPLTRTVFSQTEAKNKGFCHFFVGTAPVQQVIVLIKITHVHVFYT